MPHPLEYAVNGALLQCSEGTMPMPFAATPRTTKISGQLVGNTLDVIPFVNIPSFLICKKLTQLAGGTPTPCTPVVATWEDTNPTVVGGAPGLLFQSCLHCTLGQGKIEFMTSGQTPLAPQISQAINDTKQQGKDALAQAEQEKNAVGEAGFAEGLIPIWGSGRDLINAVQTGDKLGMALNGAFLVWDVGSVVAGALSFGTATAAMMAGKAGVRTALKAAGKVAVGSAKKKMGAYAAKAALLKEGMPAALREFGAAVKCKLVKGCFPAGTLVAVEKGYMPIELIEVGTVVWSWDEITQNLALKSVSHVSQTLTDRLVEFRVGSEWVRATPEHPFLTENEWKEAGELVLEEGIIRSDGVTMPVRDLNLIFGEAPVYNLEVTDTHTYLVSQWMLIVHNACDVLEEIYDLIGKRNLNETGRNLLELIKNTKNELITIGNHKVILDKQGLTHILGRHHPAFKLDEKAATMFPKSMSVEEIKSAAKKLIQQNQEEVTRIMNSNGGRFGQIEGEVDGVLYQLGFKNRGHIGQFFPKAK
jgi:hypothetical protein